MWFPCAVYPPDVRRIARGRWNFKVTRRGEHRPFGPALPGIQRSRLGGFCSVAIHVRNRSPCRVNGRQCVFYDALTGFSALIAPSMTQHLRPGLPGLAGFAGVLGLGVAMMAPGDYTEYRANTAHRLSKNAGFPCLYVSRCPAPVSGWRLRREDLRFHAMRCVAHQAADDLFLAPPCGSSPGFPFIPSSYRPVQ